MRLTPPVTYQQIRDVAQRLNELDDLKGLWSVTTTEGALPCLKHTEMRRLTEEQYVQGGFDMHHAKTATGAHIYWTHNTVSSFFFSRSIGNASDTEYGTYSNIGIIDNANDTNTVLHLLGQDVDQTDGAL